MAAQGYMQRRNPLRDIVSRLALGMLVTGGIPTVKEAGAKGNGTTNDTAAFAAKLAANAKFRVPAGTYKWSTLPSLSGVTMIDMVGDGYDNTIIELDAGAPVKTMPTGDLAALRVQGIQLKGFDTCFHITGDIGEVDLDKVKLRESKCLFTDDPDDYNGSGTPENFTINHLRVDGCNIEGGECLISAVVNVLGWSINANVGKDLTHDDDFFFIRVGNDSEIEQPVWLTQGKGTIAFNKVDGMASTSGSDVVMNGIVAMGNDVDMIYNQVFNLTGSGTNCEALYGKIHRGKVIGNTAHNAGMNQGAICIKGAATGMPAASAPIGTNVEIAQNNISFDADYETSRSHVGIHIETDKTWAHHNTITGTNLYGIEWNSQSGAVPVNVRIDWNDISEGWGRGIQATGHAKGLKIRHNNIHDWVAAGSGVAPIGIVLNDSAATVSSGFLSVELYKNTIDFRFGAEVTGQVTGIACAWSNAKPDDCKINKNDLVCTHNTDSTRGLDVNCSGTGGFNKTQIRDNEIEATLPYLNFNDANFRPTDLDFAGKVRITTTDATLAYAFTLTVADGKSIEGTVKARAIQTNGSPGLGTLLIHEQKNTGYATGGALTLNTAVVVQSPAAGVTGWASAFNTTGASARVGVDGAVGATIDWLLEWDLWCR